MNLKRLILGISAIALCLIRAGAQQPQLPDRNPITVSDIKEQLADCSINSRADQKYMTSLIARITDLEKQLADAKAAATKQSTAK